jgi:hypothetical protein
MSRIARRDCKTCAVVISVCAAFGVVIMASYGSVRGEGIRMGGRDASVTQAYLRASDGYVEELARDAASEQMAQTRLAVQIGHACPGALRGAPQNMLLKDFSREILGATAIVSRNMTVAAAERFRRFTIRLRWSDPRVTIMVRELARARSEPRRRLPYICRDARAWAATRFHVLPRATRRFDDYQSSKQILRIAKGPGTLEALIAQRVDKYETSGERRRVDDAQRRLRAAEHSAADISRPSWLEILVSLGVGQN